ncbi:MAG: anhydro-N-acetylmuramic acid kinase [Bacteroidota bacterium]
MNQYHVIGIMSGSSLDGVDFCHATLTHGAEWTFRILSTYTKEIPEDLKDSLRKSDQLSGHDLNLLDITYGEWIGQQLKEFMPKDTPVDVVGFHGHTVFHEPNQKLSLQLGNGQMISQISGLEIVDDFRTKDLLLGGQGAPLVPKGDLSLFPEYQGWVNLGGIANVTIKKNEKIHAWDIAPCNQVLNFFAQKLGAPFDKGGRLAEKGSLDISWLEKIQGLSYFKLQPPKAMSNQWVVEQLLKEEGVDAGNALHSFVEFLSDEIAQSISQFLSKDDRVFFTGGGAHNKYLMSKISEKLTRNGIQIVIPSSEIIDHKEALIFGFLGILRKLNLPNTLGIATGASHDTIAGVLHTP